MDLEFALIGSSVVSGAAAVRLLKEAGVKPSDLSSPDAAALYGIVLNHMERYRKPPHPDTLLELARTDLSGIKEPFEFYFDIYNQNRLKADLVALNSELNEHLDGGSASEALSFMDAEMRRIRQRSTITSRAQPIFNLSQAVVEEYEKAKRGEHGILTRWPTINDMTMGFYPGDFVLIVARTSVGKTWISLIMAIDAWQMEENRKKVLYVTTEMTQIRMARRFAAIHLRLPFGQFCKGRLGEFAEAKFKEEMRFLEEEKNFFIIGGDFDFSIDSLHAAIDQVEPDILFLDGAYLMKGDGTSRTERMSNTFDRLKRLNHRTNIPFVLTTQLNRGAAVAGQPVGTHNIAMSDVAGWHAELAFALTRNAQMKDKKRLQIDPMKIREGEEKSTQIGFDMNKMSFEEVDPALDDDDDDDEPDAGDAQEDVGGEF